MQTWTTKLLDNQYQQINRQEAIILFEKRLGDKVNEMSSHISHHS